MPTETNDEPKQPTVNLSVSIPHVEQYTGPFAVRDGVIEAVVSYFQNVQLSDHVERAKLRAAGITQQDGPPPVYEIQNGVAVFPVVGLLTKYGTSLGYEAGLIGLRHGIRDATRANVKAAAFVFDTPGGSVSGTMEAADEIAAMGIPTVAVISDQCTSGGYWLASQCDRILANNASASSGSIGVYTYVDDVSEAFAKLNIKRYVIQAGKFKASGLAGTKVTDEQLAYFQSRIEEYHRLFIAAVAKGRGQSIEQVEAYADGRVYLGEEALALGLIDGYGSVETVVAGFATAPRMKGRTMAEEDKTQEASVSAQPATIAELKREFPDTSAEWREGCAVASMTMDQAKAAYTKDLQARLAESEKAKAKAEKDRDAAVKAKADAEATDGEVGVDVSDDANVSDDSGTDARAEFDQLVRERMKSGEDRKTAIRTVANAHPDLHKSYLRQTNDAAVHALIK